LAYKQAGRWTDVKSADINEYLKEAADGNFSAKDFRTWNATVLAALALSVSGEAAGGTKTARKRAVKRAIDEVAHYLGNTPAVCRASYIDPRVFDRYDGGVTIAGVLAEMVAETGNWPSLHRSVEDAVLDLLEDDRDSYAIEKVA